MPYDQKLAQRLAEILAPRSGMEEKKTFGGIAWMLNGNMCVGVHKDCLITRVGIETAEKLFEEPFVRPMDITGKPMRRWCMVDPKGIERIGDIERYVGLAIDFVNTLPAKKKS